MIPLWLKPGLADRKFLPGGQSHAAFGCMTAAYAQDLIRRALAGEGASPGDGADLRAVLREELDTALYGEMFETRLTRIVRQEIQRAAGMG